MVLRDISLALLETFDVGQNVRSVHVHNNNILVGTYEGAVMEIDTQTKDITVIMQVGAPCYVVPTQFLCID